MAKGQMPEGLRKYFDDKKAGNTSAATKAPIPVMDDDADDMPPKKPSPKPPVPKKPVPYNAMVPTQVSKHDLHK